MRVKGRILVLLLLLSPVIVEESRLLVLRLGARWNTPRFIAGNSFAREADGTTLGGGDWSVRRSGGSGGSNTDLTVYGIWLVEPGPTGYCLTPIVRNPVSLIAREPEFLLMVLARAIF